MKIPRIQMADVGSKLTKSPSASRVVVSIIRDLCENQGFRRRCRPTETVVCSFGQQIGEDNCSERDTFDQSGREEHVRADAASGFGLTGDGFASLSADLADAPAAAEDCQTHTD